MYAAMHKKYVSNNRTCARRDNYEYTVYIIASFKLKTYEGSQ